MFSVLWGIAEEFDVLSSDDWDWSKRRVGSAGSAQWHQATSHQDRAAPATAQGPGQTFPKHNVTHIIYNILIFYQSCYIDYRFMIL